MNFFPPGKSNLPGPTPAAAARFESNSGVSPARPVHMENKIFLQKYRVSPKEIETVGELRDDPLAYQGEEIESGKKVVVELVPAASLKPSVREQLEAEAIAARKLNHVNIPTLYDFAVEDDQLVYVSEDFDGTLAEEWVNAHGPMPVGAVLRIASQVVSALGAAALHRIVHHAINPANVVLVPGQTSEGEWPLVKVLHFVGVAPKFTGADVAVAAFDKSAHYASPEQLQHGTVDFRSEVYSLGCTMWFLLTGAPPLQSAGGPLSVPAKPADKLRGVPKVVRRLLTQMLSADPNDRPGDPLAFYRQLQDCLAQVERRATMALRFGTPSSRSDGVISVRRRIPMKALALAAVLLAIATLTALVLPGYLKHRRVVRAEEPIGVPVGVPETAPSTPPVNADTANAAVQNQTQPTPVIITSNSNAPVTADTAEQNSAPLPLATNPPQVASANQVPAAPAQPAPPPQSQPEQHPPPAQINSATIASVNRVEPGPSQTAAPPAKETVAPEKTAPKRTVLHEVRRAQPAEPEVRPAEPAPPEEGPADTTIASEGQTDPVPQTEEIVKTEPTVPSAKSAKRTEADKKISSKSRAKKNERDAKSKGNADRRIYVTRTAPNFENGMPPLPPGSVRARFVGVTADGRWMLALPSRKVIVVPPPPSEP
jgi:serine/threonine protein kinase